MPLTPEQKDKARWSRILKIYGITKEQYQSLDLGFCPICLREWSETVHPVVDHHHREKKVRGVICRYCNHKRVGHHTDWEIVERIVTYLKQPFPFENQMPIKPRRKPRKRKAKKINND